MATIPSKVETRIKDALKRFQPIIEQAKSRDVGEADTSTLVKDILADLFGYEKYSEITAEYQIKGTYCDLALKIDGKLSLLIEVKSVNSELKDSHVKQAVDYAANQGIEWVVLTNAQYWQIFRVTFAQPISSELLININFLSLAAKNQDDIDSLFLLTREAHSKSVLDEFHLQKQALSKFCVGAIILTEPVLSVIRRELKRVSPDVRIDISDLQTVITEEVIKRDVLEGDKASEAKKTIARAISRPLRVKQDKEDLSPVVPTQETAPVSPAQNPTN